MLDYATRKAGLKPFGVSPFGLDKFSPLDVPNLLLYREADQEGIVKDGSNFVSSLPDLSLGAHTFAQGTGNKQPQWIDNIQNGLPVIRFDGVDDATGDQLTHSSTVISGSGPRTVMVVGIQRGIGNYDAWLRLGTTRGLKIGPFIQTSTANKPGIGASTSITDGIARFNGLTLNNVPVIYTARCLGTNYSSANVEFWRNGVALSFSDGFTGAMNTSGASIMGFGGVSSRHAQWDFIGDCAFNRALTDSEIASLHRYFNRKYNIY